MATVYVFRGRVPRNTADVDDKLRQHISMLTILHAACKTALDAFYAADNAVDNELVADLEKMVERTRVELQRLVERAA